MANTINIVMRLSSAGLTSGLGTVTAAFRGLADTARSVFGVGGLLGGAGLAGLGVAAVKVSADFERTQIAIETLVRDADRAGKLIADLQQFALESPFGFKEVQEAGKQLLAYGFAVDEVVPSLRSMGEVSAALNIPLARLVYQLGTAKQQTAVFNRDINQMAAIGVPIVGELAKVLGVTEGEVRNLASSAQISAGQFFQAFNQVSAGRFAGGMTRGLQAVGGQWGRFTEELTLIMKKLGDSIIEGLDLRGVMRHLSNAMPAIRKAVGDLAPTFRAVGEFAATAFEKIAVGSGYALDALQSLAGFWMQNVHARLIEFGAVVTDVAAKAADAFNVVSMAANALTAATEAWLGPLREAAAILVRVEASKLFAAARLGFTATTFAARQALGAVPESPAGNRLRGIADDMRGFAESVRGLGGALLAGGLEFARGPAVADWFNRLRAGWNAPGAPPVGGPAGLPGGGAVAQAARDMDRLRFAPGGLQGSPEAVAATLRHGMESGRQVNAAETTARGIVEAAATLKMIWQRIEQGGLVALEG